MRDFIKERSTHLRTPRSYSMTSHCQRLDELVIKAFEEVHSVSASCFGFAAHLLCLSAGPSLIDLDNLEDFCSKKKRKST